MADAGAVSLAAGAWPVRHSIDRAVAAGDMIHVHIDLASITDRRRRLMDDVESVMRQVASYAGQGRLSTQRSPQRTPCATNRTRARLARYCGNGPPRKAVERIVVQRVHVFPACHASRRRRGSCRPELTFSMLTRLSA